MRSEPLRQPRLTTDPRGTMPPDVLRDWERLPEDELHELAQRVPDKVLDEITGAKS